MKKLLLFAFIISTVSSARAQWQPFELSGEDVISLVTLDSSVYAGCLNSGLFVFNISNPFWTQVTGIDQSTSVMALTLYNSTIYLGTGGEGAFQSTNGTTWTQVNGIGVSATVYSFAFSGSTLVAGTDGGVLISTNSGTTWHTANTGLTNTTVTAVAIKGSVILAGTYNGLFYSTNNGSNWSVTNLNALLISAITVANNNFFVGCRNGGGVYISSAGTNFTAINNGLPFEQNITSFLATGPDVLMTGDDGLYLTEDNGAVWDSISTGQADIYDGSESLCTYFGALLVGTIDGVYENALGSLTGIKEASDPQSDFKIYPNPATNNLIIEATGTGWQQIQVSDMTGRLLLTSPVTNAKTSIDVSGLAPGIYLVSLKNEGSVATQKLIVAR